LSADRPEPSVFHSRHHIYLFALHHDRNTYIGSYTISAGCDLASGGSNEFWTAVLAQGTVINLPGDQPREPAGNLSSAHALVCVDTS